MTQPAPTWIADATSLADFRKNPEAFRLKHRLHLVPAAPDDKMRAGSAVHAALNVWFTIRDADAAVAQVAAFYAATGGAAIARPQSYVERVVRAYATRYPRALDPFTVLSTEQYVEGDIAYAGGAFRYCGIEDRVVEFADGSVYVMDTKTTGLYVNSAWLDTLSLSDQMTGYVALRRARGLRCDGFLVDAIHFNDRTQNVDAAKDFLRYGPVRVEDWRVERWAADVAYTLAQIRALDDTRGATVPWPLYQNWSYGKVDGYREFYVTPPELHASTAKLFEVRAWEPRSVAEARAAGVGE